MKELPYITVPNMHLFPLPFFTLMTPPTLRQREAWSTTYITTTSILISRLIHIRNDPPLDPPPILNPIITVFP